MVKHWMAVNNMLTVPIILPSTRDESNVNKSFTQMTSLLNVTFIYKFRSIELEHVVKAKCLIDEIVNGV